MSKNSDLYDRAVEAANQLFDDTSVLPAETRSQLKGLIAEIEELISTIPEEE